jgi:hypothetical protein
MNRKLQFLNVSMGLIVLFAILFQSVHSFEHLAKQLSEKQCHHKYHSHKTEINHSHDDFDNCFVCEFTFSNFISASKPTYNFADKAITTKYSFVYSKEVYHSFKGSLFSLRAPPHFIG